MATRSRQLNVTLNRKRAAKLTQLAERTDMNEGSMARSLLSQALDDADADPRDVVALLDRIPGAFERAQVGLKQARSKRTIDLIDL